MKKKLLALLSLFLALVVFFSPCICSLDKVSAADSVSFPDDFFISSTVDSTVYKNAFNKLKENSNLPPDSYVLLNIYGQNCEIFIISSDFDYEYSFQDGFWGGTTTLYFGDCIQFFCNFDSLDSYSFSLDSYDASSTSQFRLAYNSGLIFPWFAVNTQFSNGSPIVINNNPNYRALFNNKFPAYVPDYNLLVGFPVAFQFNEQDFYNWIIDNNKLSELPSYITSSKLLSFLNFYKQFGSSNTSFVTRIVSWFSHMNIANQSNENIVILKNAIDKLYQEYINQYKHEFYSNSANQAHHRRNIQTQTDDDDLTLVTDDQTDDIYTKLLREIIRGIIALQVTVSEGHRAIIDTLNNLDFTVAVSNNGGDFHFPNLEELFTPTYSGFDDLEDQFFDKFPFLLDLKDLPEIEDYLEEEEQGDNLQVAALTAGSETVEVDPLKTRDDLFRFTVPENNNFMNGAVSGMSIDFASFTKFAPAIEALKGIISVIALFGFSHWLIKFAPKLLHGYASSD